jgi:hypothetical protein
MSTILSVVKLAYHVSSVLIVFRRFFTCIALSDVNLRLSLIVVSKADADKGGNTSAA